jgi:hypothetical protein
MSEAIDWDMLQSQFFSNSQYYETLSKMCKIVDDPFECKLCQMLGNVRIVLVLNSLS